MFGLTASLGRVSEQIVRQETLNRSGPATPGENVAAARQLPDVAGTGSSTSDARLRKRNGTRETRVVTILIMNVRLDSLSGRRWRGNLESRRLSQSPGFGFAA